MVQHAVVTILTSVPDSFAFGARVAMYFWEYRSGTPRPFSRSPITRSTHDDYSPDVVTEAVADIVVATLTVRAPQRGNSYHKSARRRVRGRARRCSNGQCRQRHAHFTRFGYIGQCHRNIRGRDSGSRVQGSVMWLLQRMGPAHAQRGLQCHDCRRANPERDEFNQARARCRTEHSVLPHRRGRALRNRGARPGRSGAAAPQGEAHTCRRPGGTGNGDRLTRNGGTRPRALHSRGDHARRLNSGIRAMLNSRRRV